MKGYSLIVAEDDVEPEWPEMPLADILRLGFKDKLIQTLDHVVLRQLRGEA